MAGAGGPRWTAGSAYFNASVEGHPLVWDVGTLIYYTDQGELSSYVSNTQAASMVAAASAPWTQVATAAVTITSGGTLAEDVNGSNVSGVPGAVVWPADVESTAVPLAVVYDADGSVLNTVFGAGASDASGCLTNAVTSINDGFTVTGYLDHAIVILNGLCATNATQLANMQYLLTREFGRILGLDWSQANDNVWTGNPQPSESDYEGWPLMHPINLDCGSASYDCVPNPGALTMDDRAALGRIYPATVFSKSTVRLHGTITFAGGQGMQGVVVQATRLFTGTTTTDASMVASCVSGFAFRGNVGNVVTGTVDSEGNPLTRFGSANATVEGEYDLAGLELVSGGKTVDYELTFTAVNPLYTGTEAVGPDTLGTPAPSGTLATVIVRGLVAGSDVTENVSVTNSAQGSAGFGNTAATAMSPPGSGEWSSWISGYGDVDWLAITVRPNRQFSVITVAENESGAASQSKAMPVVGAWFADDVTGSAADFVTPQAFDSSIEGTTVLQVQTPMGDGALAYPMLLAIADARGDGRPDYAYAGRIFYADSLSTDVVPSTGGVVAVYGAGFVSGQQVLVNGVSAAVVATSAQQLLVQVPSASVVGNPTGGVDVEVDDPTGGIAVMGAVLSYGTMSADSLEVIGVPGGNGPASGAVGVQAPGAFSVLVVDGNGYPVANAAVNFSDVNGSQLSACGGGTNCSVTASSSGVVSTAVTPTQAGFDTITASLADGAEVQAQWTAVVSAESLQFSVLPLEVEAGQALNWPVSVTALANGVPIAATTVTWTLMHNSVTLTSTSQTNASGVATKAVAVPALGVGSVLSVQACLADDTCASVAATGVSPIAPVAIPISGTSQTVNDAATLAPVEIEITDGAIPGNALAGLSVEFTQQLFSYEPVGADGKQPPAKLLQQTTQTVVSDTHGMVAVQPLQQSGVPGTVVIAVSSGEASFGTYTLSLTPGSGASGGDRMRHRQRNTTR